MPANSTQNKFDELDSATKTWLQSDTVFNVILDLNQKAGAFGASLESLPKIIVSIATGSLKPENLAWALDREWFFADAKIIEKTAETIKQRIFKPIAPALKKLYGIDVEKLSTVPPPEAPAKPAVPAPIVAQVTRSDRPIMADIKKPAPSQPMQTAPASEPTLKAQTTRLDRPFTAPPAPQSAAPAATPTKEKSASGVDLNKVEVTKPFGFVEVVPAAPAPQVKQESVPSKTPTPHNIVPYHDEHPMIG